MKKDLLMSFVILTIGIAIMTDVVPVRSWLLKLESYNQAQEKIAAEQMAVKQKQSDQITANWLIKNMKYIQDPRTNLCYSYERGHSESYACVPCGEIPSDMLVIAEINSDN